MQELAVNVTYGDYVCTHLIAGDGDGAVYRAYHPEKPDNIYAVRTLQLPMAKSNTTTIEACHNHMAMVKNVTAPHLVPVLSYGSSDHEYFIIMPYIKGKSLRAIIKQTDRQPESMPSFSEILSFAKTMVEALDRIHEAGLTHGALEPRNILIDKNKTPYLNDFGLAKLTKIAFSLSNTGSFWTGKYTAPEVWDGERNTPASDQYSLACIMYLLLTGSAPFKAKTIFEMMNQHKNAIVNPPHYIRKDAPSSLLMFFLTATAKRPAERYRSLQEMVNEFAMMIDGKDDEATQFFDIEDDIPQ